MEQTTIMEFDPLGIGSYMRSRMRELLGPDIIVGQESLDIPRFVRNDPSLMEEIMPISSVGEVPFSSFYINPDVDWAFPEGEFSKASTTKEMARGHRPISGGGTEILDTPNTRPARPPRRLFRVDVTEGDEHYFLRADLAGMTKSNVNVSVMQDQNLVNISVEPPKDDFFGLYMSPLESKNANVKRVEEKVESSPTTESEEKQQQQQQQQPSQGQESPVSKKEICHLIERCSQPMTRSLKMPKEVDMSNIEAEMRDGLLVVKFAKKQVQPEQSKKLTIEIK